MCVCKCTYATKGSLLNRDKKHIFFKCNYCHICLPPEIDAWAQKAPAELRLKCAQNRVNVIMRGGGPGDRLMYWLMFCTLIFLGICLNFISAFQKVLWCHLSQSVYRNHSIEVSVTRGNVSTGQKVQMVWSRAAAPCLVHTSLLFLTEGPSQNLPV